MNYILVTIVFITFYNNHCQVFQTVQQTKTVQNYQSDFSYIKKDKSNFLFFPTITNLSALFAMVFFLLLHFLPYSSFGAIPF